MGVVSRNLGWVSCPNFQEIRRVVFAEGSVIMRIISLLQGSLLVQFVMSLVHRAV